jgi:DNA-binding response OmpR family regulator
MPDASGRPAALIVEDEPAILRVVAAAVSSVGFHALTAQDAETGLDLLNDSRPEIILVDVRLPGMDGVEFTRRVKERRDLASTPVLLMSAYSEPRPHPGDAFIAKPFDIDQLTDLVLLYAPNSSP